MKFFPIKFKQKAKNIKGLECLNCGQPFSGNENFCSYCGQKNTVKQLSFATFVNNMFSGFLSYDSRFWRTFIPLLTQPGQVSKKFIEGKRARYVNPFQMYLNVSIIFFLVLGISNKIDGFKNPSENIIKTNISNDSLVDTAAQLDSILKISKENIASNLPKDSTNAKILAGIDDISKEIKTDIEERDSTYKFHIKTKNIDEISFSEKMEDFEKYQSRFPKYPPSQAIDSLGYEKSFWNNFYYQQIVNSKENIEQIKTDNGKMFLKKLTSSISISLFVFLPIFTLFLWLLYVRKKYTYMEHLVFVFHTQTVFFLLLTIFYLLNFIVTLDNVRWVFIVLFLIYLYKAMRFFYQQRRAKTIAKFILANFFYMFLGGIGLSIVAAISFVSN